MVLQKGTIASYNFKFPMCLAKRYPSVVLVVNCDIYIFVRMR